MYIRFWSVNLKRRNYPEDLVVDGKIIDWTLKKWGWRMWTGFI
jgi:hypothetical protein